MELEALDMVAGETKRYPPPGRCIYCGDADSKLTDEHVLPFALTGNSVIFEKASCVACAATIQPYEQSVLRSQLGNFRARIDAPTRRKKERPTTVSIPLIEVDDYGRWMRDLGKRQVPLTEAPLALSLWELPPPGILGERTTSAQRRGKAWAYVSPKPWQTLAKRVREETGSNHVAMNIGTVNRNNFLRFLAKIAHAYAVAEQGLEKFQPLLNDLILCRSNILDSFVGCDPGNAQHEGDPANMTELSIGQVANGPVKGNIVVRIRLYPMLNTPAYAVIVGPPHAEVTTAGPDVP